MKFFILLCFGSVCVFRSVGGFWRKKTWWWLWRWSLSLSVTCHWCLTGTGVGSHLASIVFSLQRFSSHLFSFKRCGFLVKGLQDCSHSIIYKVTSTTSETILYFLWRPEQCSISRHSFTSVDFFIVLVVAHFHQQPEWDLWKGIFLSVSACLS
jgi:hypothetical protein